MNTPLIYAPAVARKNTPILNQKDSSNLQPKTDPSLVPKPIVDTNTHDLFVTNAHLEKVRWNNLKPADVDSGTWAKVDAAVEKKNGSTICDPVLTKKLQAEQAIKSISPNYSVLVQLGNASLEPTSPASLSGNYTEAQILAPASFKENGILGAMIIALPQIGRCCPGLIWELATKAGNFINKQILVQKLGRLSHEAEWLCGREIAGVELQKWGSEARPKTLSDDDVDKMNYTLCEYKSIVIRKNRILKKIVNNFLRVPPDRSKYQVSICDFTLARTNGIYSRTPALVVYHTVSSLISTVLGLTSSFQTYAVHVPYGSTAWQRIVKHQIRLGDLNQLLLGRFRELKSDKYDSADWIFVNCIQREINRLNEEVQKIMFGKEMN